MDSTFPLYLVLQLHFAFAFYFFANMSFDDPSITSQKIKNKEINRKYKSRATRITSYYIIFLKLFVILSFFFFSFYSVRLEFNQYYLLSLFVLLYTIYTLLQFNVIYNPNQSRSKLASSAWVQIYTN